MLSAGKPWWQDPQDCGQTQVDVRQQAGWKTGALQSEVNCRVCADVMEQCLLMQSLGVALPHLLEE